MMFRAFSALLSTDEKRGESAIHAPTAGHGDTFSASCLSTNQTRLMDPGWLLGYDLSIAKTIAVAMLEQPSLRVGPKILANDRPRPTFGS